MGTALGCSNLSRWRLISTLWILPMTLIIDAYYTIGRLHRFCQDYLCQGLEPVPHLILADGCSATPDSDLGARLLVLNARWLLPYFIRAVEEKEHVAQHWRLGRRIVRRAARQARALGLDEDVLDATLLIAWCDGTTVYIHLYGDGCITVRRADGEVAVIQVEYVENTPYYLSYLLDSQRHRLYQEAVSDPMMAQITHYQSPADGTTRHERFDAPSVFSFDLAAFPIVAVATDGLDSFMDIETGQRQDLLTVAQGMLDFRDLNGAFVQRRLPEVLIEYAQRRVFCCDDIGLGAFIALDDTADAESSLDAATRPT